MKEDILSVIQERMPTFSKGQRRIGAYILENCDKAAFMTANRLGKTADASESTVVRFAMELGFDGYPGMQKAMQEAMLHRLSSPQIIENDGDHITKVLHADADLLNRTADTLDRDAFSAAVDAIIQGNCIYIIGVRASAALANLAGYYLGFLFSNVHIITASGEEMMERLVNVEKGDVVIAFDFPPYSETVVQAVRFCKDTGVTTVSITDRYSSTLAKVGDHVLVAQSSPFSFAGSLAAPFGVVNTLVAELASKREEVLSKNLNKMDRFKEMDNTYEKKVEKP